MDTVRVVRLIETTLKRRGEGKSPDDPMRIVTQYWTLEGQLVFEVDSHLEPCHPVALGITGKV